MSSTNGRGNDVCLVSKPQLTVYLLGYRPNLGQSTLKDHWSNSVGSVALDSIALVELTIETDLNAILSKPPSSVNDKQVLSVYLIFFDSQDEETVRYANELVGNLLNSFSQCDPLIHLIETSGVCELKCLPDALAQYSFLQFHRIDSTTCRQDDAALESIYKVAVFQPLLQSMDEEDIDKTITEACRNGRSDVVKGFISLGVTPNLSKWLTVLMEVLQSVSCTDKIVPSILATADFLNSLEPQKSTKFVWSTVSEFPRGSLMLLTRFTNSFNDVNPQLLYLPKSGLTELSARSVAETRYTHVALSSNGLTCIPEELLQLSALITLDLSNNQLERLPSIIRWNCPKLRELNLSRNRLKDAPQNLFKSASLAGKRVSMHAGLTNESHAAPQRMVLRLTGQNLYPCIHSLASVDISHNPDLTRVPEWVCVLPHIAEINLRGLPKLVTLPQELGYWSSLSIIQLEPERMISPPAVVCAQRSQAMIAYLRSQLKGSAHYRHMVIMVLGRNKSGKTSIFKALVNAKQASSNSYDYRGKANEETNLKINYRLIDFSDEGMRYHVYQRFLVNRCVYVFSANAHEGVAGLKALLPHLRNIASCLSDARVILIITHVDEVGGVSLPDAFTWIKEAFNIEHPSSLNNPQYARDHGLPIVSRLFLFNVNDSNSIEQLKDAIHWVSGDLLGVSPDPSTELTVPRLYTMLQGLVDTRLKRSNTNTNQRQPSIVKYEELFDSFKNLSGDLNDEMDEFNLACSFLQESGIMAIQFIPDSSDLYFLDSQWLIDAITRVLDTCTSGSGGSVVRVHELKSCVADVGVLPSYIEGFVKLLEDKRLVVPVDVEKTVYLFLHRLPLLPESGYQSLNPAHPNILARLVSLKSVSGKPRPSVFPSALLPAFQHQIITSLYRLGAQLMVLSNTSKSSAPVNPFNNYSGVDSIKQSKAFTLGRHGYVENKSRREIEDNGQEQMSRIRGMSFSSRVDTIQRNLAHVKLKSLSTTTFPSGSVRFASSPPASGWVTDGSFWQGMVWAEGIYMEYGDGTIAWVEGGVSDVTIATQGDESARVKALMFLMTCLNSVLEDRFPYLETETFVPCSHCVSNGTNEAIAITDPSSSLRNTSLFSMNEIVSKVVSSPKEHTLTCTKCNNKTELGLVTPELLLKDFESHYKLEGTIEIEDNDGLLEQQQQLQNNKFCRGIYDDENVAVKTYQNQGNGLLLIDHLRSELNILTNLSHVNLLTPVGVVLHPHWALVFPQAPLGSLWEHIQLCPSGFNDHLSHQLLYQIADGLHYLHSLFIIHRDVNPRNVWVWSLDPVNGVHIKISDCGLSQYRTPVGCGQLGTEDFMAPELSSPGRRLFYNEKVDIFSFGIMLYSIVSGKSLVPGSLYKSDSQTTNLSLSLGQAITSSMEEQRPRDNQAFVKADSILKNGVHPASRQGLVSMCVAKCLQSLLKDCLWKDPTRRPSADGICSHLLLCTAPSTQERIIIQQDFPVVGAMPVPPIRSVLAWGNHGNQLLMVSSDMWSVRSLDLQLPEGFVRSRNLFCLATGSTLYITSCKSRQLLAFSLNNSATSLIGSAPKGALPSNPCCLFSSTDGDRLFVGMEGGRVAMFRSTAGKSILESPPMVGKTLEHPDRRKTPVRCGIAAEDLILCGCGRYLIGLDHTHLQQKFFKPLTDQGTMVSGMVIAGDKVWVWLADCSEIIICNLKTGNRVDSIDIRKCLRDSIHNNESEILVTTVSMATPIVWVGTNSGHVMGFNVGTLELLVGVQHHSTVESIVTLDGGSVLLVFGKWAVEDGTVMEGFSVWKSHLSAMFNHDNI